jgi:O-antigen/teichoic acid export membrane protein
MRRATRLGVVRNSAGSLLIQGSSRLGRILAIIPAAAVLDAEAFASLALALALTDVARASLLAYDVSAVRLIGGGGNPGSVVGSHAAAKVTVGLLGALLAVVAAWLTDGPGSAALTLVAGVGVVPAGLSTLLLARRQADLELGSVSRVVLVGNIAGMVVASIGVAVTRSPLAVVAGLAIGDIIVLAALSGGLREARRPSAGSVTRVLSESRYLLGMQIAYIGQFRIGVVILAAASTPQAVGTYAVASRMAEGLVIVAAAISASTLPLLRGERGGTPLREIERIARRAYRFALLASTTLVAILSLAAPLWLGLLFPAYPDAALVFVPVGLTIVGYFANSQTTAYLNATHHDRQATASAVIGLLVAAAASVGLVSFAATGVAVGRLLGEVARGIIETWAVARRSTWLVGGMLLSWLFLLPAIATIVAPALAGWGVIQATVGTAVVGLFAGLAARSWSRGDA